jgi:hypothetical protein
MAPDDVIAEIRGFSDPDATPLPWSAGLEQVIAADTFWLSTVRPDGRPHVTPLIAVWSEPVLQVPDMAAPEPIIDTTPPEEEVAVALGRLLQGRNARIRPRKLPPQLRSRFQALRADGILDRSYGAYRASHIALYSSFMRDEPPTGSL